MIAFSYTPTQNDVYPEITPASVDIRLGHEHVSRDEIILAFNKFLAALGYRAATTEAPDENE